MSGSKAPVTVRITYENQTPRAILTKPNGRAVWIPKSKIYNFATLPSQLEQGEEYDIELPEWLAEKEGLNAWPDAPKK